jgi:hypothetical protein
VAALQQGTAAARRPLILVALGDPRFAQQVVERLPAPPPTLVAWSGDRGMQQAAARSLLRTR